MIKQLFFIAALLVPVLAYGANPSAPFSDQVVPAQNPPPPPPGSIACAIGPNYTGSIPAPAQAAGYTTCAANYDFTTPTFSTLSTWLGNCGASSPILWAFFTGNTGCGDISMVSDGGSNSLLLANPASPGADSQIVILSADNGSGGGNGATFPIGNYAEVVVRTTSNTYYADLFFYLTGLTYVSESDIAEAAPAPYNNTSVTNGASTFGGCTFDATAAPSAGQCYYSAFQNFANDVTNYHTYGVLTTIDGNALSDGSHEIAGCTYYDGTLIVSSSSPCGWNSFTNTIPPLVAGTGLPLYNRNTTVWDTCQGNSCSTVSNLYIKRVTVWECPG
jgi:hypothetical protein